MRIIIAERLKPFTHLPGFSTPLPGTPYKIQIFPTLLRIFDITEHPARFVSEWQIKIKGPVEQFTFCNDLEKGRITVSGRSHEGWLRYHLIGAMDGKGIRLAAERTPGKGLQIQGSLEFFLRNREWCDLILPISAFEPFCIPRCDRLSLGVTKAQDWDLVRRRKQLVEILPFVHRLGQIIHQQYRVNDQDGGTLSLLNDCFESLTSKKTEELQERLNLLLLGCFNEMLVPELEDCNYQGLIDSNEALPFGLSPLSILHRCSRLIRAIFIQQEHNELVILPSLIPAMHCGRLIDVAVGGGIVGIEWSKKAIRRIVFTPDVDKEWIFAFRSNVKSFRLRRSFKDKGERISNGKPFFFEKGGYYFFDNFQ